MSFVPRSGWLKKMRAPLHERSYELSLSHFVNAVRGERPLEFDLMDGFKSAAAIAAAEESARTGRVTACERRIAVGF